ncbi:MAG: hypothetical protein U1E39_07860 [Planctomycetota bacterium]
MDRRQRIVGAGVGAAVAALVVLASIPTEPPRPVAPRPAAPTAAEGARAPEAPTAEAPSSAPAGSAVGTARDADDRSSGAASAATGTRAGHGGLGVAATRAFDDAKAHGKPLLVFVAPTVEASKPARTGALTAVLGRGRTDVGLAFALVAEVMAAPRAALGDAIVGDGPSPFAVLFETDGTTPSTVVVPWDPALDAVGMRWGSLALGRAFRSSVGGDATSGGPTEDEERAIAALDRLAAAVDAAVIGDRARRDRRHTQRTYVDDLLLDPAERRADPIGRLARADDAELPELRRVLTLALWQSVPRWPGLAWREDASRTPPFHVRDDAWCGTAGGVADERERLRGLARDAATLPPVAPILVFEASTP